MKKKPNSGRLAPNFDASKEIQPDKKYAERRRGSMVEPRSKGDNDLIAYTQKEVTVRTPRRGRSKSIVVPGTQTVPRAFPIGRLNNYNKNMKKHKGPVSLVSELESIDEAGELSDKFDSSYNKNNSRQFNQEDFCLFDADKEDQFQNQGFYKEESKHAMPKIQREPES